MFADLVYPEQQHWQPFQTANRNLPICGKPELNKDSYTKTYDRGRNIGEVIVL